MQRNEYLQTRFSWLSLKSARLALKFAPANR